MSLKVAAEMESGKAIHDHVLKWQKEVQEIQHEVEFFWERYKKMHSCRPLPILNPIARFVLRRAVVRLNKKITRLIHFGNMILDNDIALHATLENIPDTQVHNFKSRHDTFVNLWKELANEGGTQILGIYGREGVGKTRMVKQICEKAKETRLFNKVIWVDVGIERLDVIKLQNQIAGYLNFQFESRDDEADRASQLKNRLMNESKLLIILDDVWTKIPLDTIGISFGDRTRTSSRGCKIILTSREEEVCLCNECNHRVKITPLTIAESLDLFTDIVSTDHQIDSLAKEVCDKFGGLPLVIHAVGNAMKSMSHDSWMDTLFEIKKCGSVSGEGPDVSYCLKMSYDRLSEDAKPCLMLCSLFPEDSDIHLRKLIQLAKASHFAGVHEMVDILKSSSMLHEGKDDEHIKLHTIFRDVARSVSVSDPKHPFLFARCGSRLPDIIADYGTGQRKVLHLDLEESNFSFPDDLLFPDLHTLSLRSVSTLEPRLFFQAGDLLCMFKNLRFLVLWKFFCKKKFSLGPLSTLRSLVLDHCNLFETDVKFLPGNLETLCIWDCHLPEMLYLPNLKCLRKLEILGGTAEVVFVPNTISSLSSLEELHVPNGLFVLDDEGLSAPRLDEFRTLTKLKSLHICFSHFQASQETSIFKNLLEFNIRLGRTQKDEHYRGSSSKSLIELSGYHLEGFKGLVERAEEVTLRNTDVSLSSIWNSNRAAFTDLRNLYIEECDTMDYIAKMSKSEIQYSLLPPKSFSKLTILYITKCSAMKYLFCNSVAKCLVQLQQLDVGDCAMMEVIVMNDGTSDGDIVNFPELKSLKLCTMPRLKSFYKDNKDKHSSSTSTVDKKTTTHIQLRSIILDDLPNLKSFMHSAKYECHMPALVEVEVRNCGLSILFTCNVFKYLRELRELRVSNCMLLEAIVEDVREDETFYTNEKTIKVFQLSRMFLENLPKLKSFSPSARYAFKMPALYSFHLLGCPQIENFTSLKTSTGLVSVYTEGQHREEVSDLNEYIKQNCKRESRLSDTAQESSFSTQKLDKEAENVQEEQPLEERSLSEQKILRIELQIFINSQQEVTATKTSVHHQTLLE